MKLRLLTRDPSQVRETERGDTWSVKWHNHNQQNVTHFNTAAATLWNGGPIVLYRSQIILKREQTKISPNQRSNTIAPCHTLASQPQGQKAQHIANRSSSTLLVGLARRYNVHSTKQLTWLRIMFSFGLASRWSYRWHSFLSNLEPSWWQL